MQHFKILKPSGLVETLNLNSFLNIKIQLKCQDPFSNAIIYVLDQLIAETKTDLESTTCPLLSSILH